ncbi:MAG: hypothetical protein OEY11_08735 [Gammaproteobacteria bacterium]|nr:hypothetical protein [Gammaproteobacteria bacterium]
MKSLFSRIILSLALSLGLISAASAADIDYGQSGPIFSQSAYLVGGIGEVDTFYFTNSSAGTYHFYSTGTVDTYGYIFSDTYSSTLASNDDSASSLNFCVESYLYAGENITIYVEGYSSSSEGSYTVVGASGSCADSGYNFVDSNVSAPTGGTANSADPAEASALSLPVVLFSVLALGAVRLRRYFA